MRRIYFVSHSKKKYEEVKMFLAGTVEVEHKNVDLPKLQSREKDITSLVQRKAKDAFAIVKRPVLVEHTSLCIEAFNHLQGLDTNYFSSVFGYKKIVEYCEFQHNYEAYVESVFCVCDGKKCITASGRDTGRIRHTIEEGEDIDGGFGWDTIFVPFEDNPRGMTYAALKKENPQRRTMRKKALEALEKHNLFQENDPDWDMAYTLQEEDLSELGNLIEQKKVMLFVGAGISASVGFPTWNGLIGALGSNAGYEEDLFQCYGDNMMLAEYASMVLGNENLNHIVRETFGITDDIAGKLHSSQESKIYQALLDLDFSVIYTTNYDHLLEEFYKDRGHDCMVIRTKEDMDQVDAASGTRIMKYHGDLDDFSRDSGLVVLSESQYYARMEFRSFMDMQLQKDMQEYHILFLGYSLSDINVKLLLYRMRSGQNRRQLTDYIYTATPNQIQREVFRKNGIVTFTGIDADKKKGTLHFLEALLNQKNKSAL